MITNKYHYKPQGSNTVHLPLGSLFMNHHGKFLKYVSE